MIERLRGLPWLIAPLALVLAVAVWWLLIRPGQNADAARRADAGRQVAESREQAARDAIRTVEKTHERITRIETIQRAGVAEVLAASDDAAAAAAARRSLCMLELYKAGSACQRLLDAGPGQSEGADPGLAAARR